MTFNFAGTEDIKPAVTTFIRGCLSRERERLARIFETTSDPKEMAAAIRDSSLDDKIFEWAGQGKSLD